MCATLRSLGHEFLILDENATRAGAVETPEEGRVYAEFLEAHRGEFDGVILSLPNFGDENGAVAALKNAGVPILVQAYPDDLDKMAPDIRRDAFCGKMSIMDMFRQNGVPFTALQPHTVHPKTIQFARNIALFDGTCRAVKAMRGAVICAIGARTTAFKTVRIDEVALQKHGITVETLDLSDIFHRMKSLDMSSSKVKDKKNVLSAYTDWKAVPDNAFVKIVQLGVVIDDVINEYECDAIALRCWLELQQQLGISPCVLLSEINERGTAAACELDIGNAVTMHLLKAASSAPSACLDWNNNYADDPDKCILFHCGPVPSSMMLPGGKVVDHEILANSVGKGRSWGCNAGRIMPQNFTFGSMMTEDGAIKMYVGEGEFTRDPVPDNFFGCAWCCPYSTSSGHTPDNRL